MKNTGKRPLHYSTFVMFETFHNKKESKESQSKPEMGYRLAALINRSDQLEIKNANNLSPEALFPSPGGSPGLEGEARE